VAEITIPPETYKYVRFKPPLRFSFTVNLLSTQGEVAAIGLRAKGFDEFLRGNLPVPQRSGTLAAAASNLQLNTNPDVLFIAPPSYSFSKQVSIAFHSPVEGYWFLVLINTGKKSISVDHEVWA
jgi:hypothetical protein